MPDTNGIVVATGVQNRGRLGWVGTGLMQEQALGPGLLPCPATRLNNLTVGFQGQEYYRQPLDLNRCAGELETVLSSAHACV